MRAVTFMELACHLLLCAVVPQEHQKNKSQENQNPTASNIAEYLSSKYLVKTIVLNVEDNCLESNIYALNFIHK